MTCHGVPEYVLVKGRVCVDNGKLDAIRGFGTFLETPVNPPFVYDPINGIPNKNDKYQMDDLKRIIAKTEEMAFEIPEIDPITTTVLKRQKK